MSDGRSELAASMAGVLPGGRATRRALLEAACERVVRARQSVTDDGSASVDELSPASGYRMIRSDDAIAAGASLSGATPSAALATVARGSARPDDALSGGRVAIRAAVRRRTSWTAPLVLGLARWGTTNPASLQWLDLPPEASVSAARRTLEALGAEPGLRPPISAW